MIFAKHRHSPESFLVGVSIDITNVLEHRRAASFEFVIIVTAGVRLPHCDEQLPHLVDDLGQHEQREG